MASDARALQELRIDKRAKEPGGLSWVVWLVIFLVIAGLAVGLWVSRRSRPITVTTSLVEEPRVQSAGGTVLNASGYVTARRRATVSSKITGQVVEVLVEEGMAVRKGQVLARLDADHRGTRTWRWPRPNWRPRGARSPRTGCGSSRRASTSPRQRQLRADGIANQADLDAAEAEVRRARGAAGARRGAGARRRAPGGAAPDRTSPTRSSSRRSTASRSRRTRSRAR